MSSDRSWWQHRLSWFSHYCTVDVFAIFSPVFSLRIFYKKHAKNHTSNKPRAFKICVQLSFDKLIWYTKFHKDWSTRRQKHHWSKFFDGLVKYRTENRKTVHCAVCVCALIRNYFRHTKLCVATIFCGGKSQWFPMHFIRKVSV